MTYVIAPEAPRFGGQSTWLSTVVQYGLTLVTCVLILAPIVPL